MDWFCFGQRYLEINGGLGLKTKERVVHFYELCLTSSTTSEGITSPACASIGRVLEQCFAIFSLQYSIESKSNVLVEVVDSVYDRTTDTFKLLINRADQDVSDVTFRNFDNRKTRKGGKTKIEGIEYSSHIVIRPNVDERSAIVLMTMGSGVTAGVLERVFNDVTRRVLKNSTNSALFNFPHPSGECDAHGGRVTYKVRYKFECIAHKSALLDEALKNGSFLSMDLVAHEYRDFDSGGNLTIQEQSISVKAAHPALLSAAGLKNAVRSFLQNKPQYQFDDLRIRYKDDMNNERTTTLKTNDLDAAFTRKETIAFQDDIDAQQSELDTVIVAELEKLL